MLPYHTMGIKKYEQLGMKYPLDGVEAMDKSKAHEARELLLRIIMEDRKEKYCKIVSLRIKRQFRYLMELALYDPFFCSVLSRREEMRLYASVSV